MLREWVVLLQVCLNCWTKTPETRVSGVTTWSVTLELLAENRSTAVICSNPPAFTLRFFTSLSSSLINDTSPDFLRALGGSLELADILLVLPICEPSSPPNSFQTYHDTTGVYDLVHPLWELSLRFALALYSSQCSVISSRSLNLGEDFSLSSNSY